MSAVETRHIPRDSLFLAADVRLDGVSERFRVKVRNLSPGGMMAEGSVPVTRGARLLIDLRNIGLVEGSVAWVQENRFGIAFADEIDPKRARAPADNSAGDTGYAHRSLHHQNSAAAKDRLRNI